MEDNLKDFYSKVIYKDKHFVKIKSLNKSYGNLEEVESLSKMPKNIKIGDIVTEDFNNKNCFYNIVQKSNNTENNFDLKDLCIVTKCEQNYTYLLKNNSKDVIKINKVKDVKLYDMGYINNNSFKKDLFFKKYLLLFLNFKIQSYFSIKKYVVSYGYKNAVCLFNIEDFDDIIFEPTFKFNGNVSVGDLYYKIEIDNKTIFCIDEENYDNLFYDYSNLMLNIRDANKDLNPKEQLKNYLNILKFQEDILHKLEEVNKNFEQYNNQNIQLFNTNKIEAIYDLEEKEQQKNNFCFRALLKKCYNKNHKIVDVLYDYNLPKYPRESDAVFCVKNNDDTLSFYYYNKNIQEDLTKAIELTKYKIKLCEENYGR